MKYMKRILFYIDSLYRGGAQRVMANLITYFSAKYSVILVNDFIPVQKSLLYPIPDSVKRIYLRKSIRGNHIIKNISRIFNLRKTIKKECPDVVLSFLGNPNKRMLLASFGLNCKKFVSVRNEPSHEYGKGKFDQWFANKLFSLADGIVFQTIEASNYFQKSIRDKSKIILNPISKSFYEAKRAVTDENVITVGRFETQKNHLLLLSAWKGIEKDFPEDKLILYGDGPLRKVYEDYILHNNLVDRVDLPGVVSDVPKILRKAKLFVLSSNFEGMPNALMEAMAVGVPVISTNCPCGGPKMLIETNEQGCLVPCNDVVALQKAMKELLLSKALRERNGLAAKERAKYFEEDVIYVQWEEFIMRN